MQSFATRAGAALAWASRALRDLFGEGVDLLRARVVIAIESGRLMIAFASRLGGFVFLAFA